MKLAECRIGVLVSVKPEVLEVDEIRIGHVVGLTYQGMGRPAGHADVLLDRLKRAAPTTEEEAALAHVRVPDSKGRKVVPLVLFAGNQQATPFDYENLDLFTAF